jgi:CheY-like chemotaxis protein
LPDDALVVLDSLIPGKPFEVCIDDTNTPTYAYANLAPSLEVRISKREFFQWIQKSGIPPRSNPERTDMRHPADVSIGETSYWEEFYPEHVLSVGDVVLGVVRSVSLDYSARRIIAELDVATVLEEVQEDPEKSLRLLGYVEDLPPPLERTPLAGTGAKRDAGVYGAGPESHGYRVLLIDGDPDAIAAQAQWLETNCFNVTSCKSEADVERVLSENARECSVALIDICLAFGPQPFGGIEYAKRLQQINPHCAIVLATAQPEPAMCDIAEGLFITAFIERPQGAEREIRAIRSASRKNSQPAVSLIRSHLGLACEDNLDRVLQKPHQPDFQTRIERLKSDLCADSVIVFEYDSLTKLADIKYCVGVLLPNFKRFRKHLRYSPVRDVCEDRVEIYDVGIPEDKHLQVKHQHLLKLCADAGPYCAMAAVEVAEKAGKGLHYGVFAFKFADAHGASAFSPSLPYAPHPDFMQKAMHQHVLDLCRQCAGDLRLLMHEQWSFDREMLRNAAVLEGMAAMGMKHDLMHAIEGLDNDVYSLLHLAHTGEEPCGGMLKTTERLRRLSDSALKIVHNYSMQMKAEGEEVSVFPVDAVLEDVRKAVDMLAVDHGIDVLVDAKAVKRTLVKVQRSALYRSLFNLVINSIEHISLIHRKNGRICMQASRFSKDDLRKADRKKRGLYVRVYDSGPGMHAYQRLRAFDLGYSTRRDGCGLGLTICEEQMKRIDGAVVRCVVSPLLVGCVFEIYIPERHIHE